MISYTRSILQNTGGLEVQSQLSKRFTIILSSIILRFRLFLTAVDFKPPCSWVPSPMKQHRHKPGTFHPSVVTGGESLVSWAPDKACHIHTGRTVIQRFCCSDEASACHKGFFGLPFHEFAFWFREKKVKYRVNALCSTYSHPTCALTAVYHQVPHETDSGGSGQYRNHQLWLLDIGKDFGIKKQFGGLFYMYHPFKFGRWGLMANIK